MVFLVLASVFIPAPVLAANEIDIHPGWNFVSVPRVLAQGYNMAGVLFAGVDMAHHLVDLCESGR